MQILPVVVEVRLACNSAKKQIRVICVPYKILDSVVSFKSSFKLDLQNLKTGSGAAR